MLARMAVIKGLRLGLANVVVTAIMLAIAERAAATVVPIFMYGVVPGLAAGALIGALAGVVKSWPPPLRVVLLATPAVAVVFALADLFHMSAYAPLASVPAMAAAVVLERWTRQVTPAPIPPATVQSNAG
jgi:hypothetical protein